MKRVVLVVLAAMVFLGAKGCGEKDCAKLRAAAEAACAVSSEEACERAKALVEENCQPAPEPTPATCKDGLPPGPEGCPKTCADLACEPCEEKDGKAVCVEPKPEPTPTPTPTPGTVCNAPLEGDPNMGAYWYAPQRVVDSTPRLVNAERCARVGYAGRVTCPVVPDEHPERGICEEVLMGGPRPLYELERTEGDLRWDYEDGWKARIIGTGKGRIRACWPNGKACSAWLEIER